MENFEFVSPTHFVFGRGAEEQVGEKLAAAGAKRVLVHFGGGSAVASGLIDRVGASLDAAGIEHLELGGVRPNPEITLVREGVRLCKEANVDWVLAVGGGSVIDSAKAIANGACVEGDVWELFETKALDHDVLPIAVVLTIPAAGSEASKNTVISNDELGRKTGYANNAQRPKFAFMNPELTFTLPPFQTAAGLTDMFCHLLERFFDDVGAVPVTDNLNLSLMNTIRAEAPRVLADPENYDARANIMWAGMLCHQDSPEWAATRTGPLMGWNTSCRRWTRPSPTVPGWPSCSRLGWNTCTARTQPASPSTAKRSSASRPPATWKRTRFRPSTRRAPSSRASACPPSPSWMWKRPTSRRCCRRLPRTRASPSAPSRS